LKLLLLDNIYTLPVCIIVLVFFRVGPTITKDNLFGSYKVFVVAVTQTPKGTESNDDDLLVLIMVALCNRADHYIFLS